VSADKSFTDAVRNHQAGRLAEAEKLYRQVLATQPNHAEALHLLGVLAHQSGRLDLAIECYQRSLTARPNQADLHNHLGNIRRSQGNLQEAAAAFQAAVRCEPKHIAALHNLANCLQESGALDEAIAFYRRALAAGPDHFDVLIHLGNALVAAGRPAEAIPLHRRAVSLQPKSAVAQFNLGCALKDASQPDEAIKCFEKALVLEPGFAQAANNRGSTLKDIARLDEALAAYQQALTIQPAFREAHDNLVYAMLFHPNREPAEISAELRRWNQRHAEPLAGEIRPHENDRSPSRSLRIGYVSPDFRDHVVGRNVLPILMRHDRERFKIFCYSNVARPDALTGRFRQHCDEWRDITRVSDAAAAAMIRSDGIDILVDLALHMAHNRLPIFARKPAPIAVTWAGYPGTTGLKMVDYRVTDPHLDPPGGGDEFNSEESIRLPESFWCYDPLGVDLPVNDPPARSVGCVTFGCLNNFCKVNETTLSVCAAVLRQVETARLILLAPEGSARQWVLRVLQLQQITPQRIEFRAPRPRLEYLRLYHEIDIALDTFPYNGHTTSLDAMWMGVPVVTICGNSQVSRAGLSQLTNLGLPELAAETLESFIQIAGDLAADMPRLAELRRTLRARMERSPLMDAGRFTIGLENVYREMWRRYCGSCG
jgi:predicted O-linked N-acetylglucosamine transferase (SPINDLY family)